MKLLPLLAAALLAFHPGAWAQSPATDFPTRTVRIIVPFPSGSGPDAVVRVMAERLSRKWGQAVIVEGKPGASGAISIDALRKGAADGHNLLLVDGSSLVLAPHLSRKLAYDPERDLELVTPMFRTRFAILVPAQSRLRTAGDLVAAARAAPGKLNYGSWGIGSFGHVAGAMTEGSAGIRMEHVAYKDTNQLFLAVATGELDFAFGSFAVLNSHPGRIRALAVASPTRSPRQGDVPTIAESGGPSNVDVSGWAVFAAPRGLPAERLDRLQRDIDATLQEPEVKARLQLFGWETMELPRAQLPAFVARESARYGELIQRMKISVD